MIPDQETYQQQLTRRIHERATQLRTAEDELGQRRRQVDTLTGELERARQAFRWGLRQLRRADAAREATVVQARRWKQRAEQAEARITDLTPHIERLLAATGCMVEHWADATGTGNTEWCNDMWAELHRASDALAATLVGEPLPLNIPEGACGAYAPRHGAVCARPKEHAEAYHRDAKDRVYWLAEARP
ncbi:hypothetical protein [Kitasatospora purpeofusca]|uniref:hypothetical protein n=1 Tax=Kitasatospora purpeofusca TaxID=67352 RepID=UPI003651B9C1